MPEEIAVGTRFEATISVGSLQYTLCLPHDEGDDIPVRLAGTRRPLEEALLEAMAVELTAEDLVLDVGAGIGNHTVYLAVVAGCRVVAFEPDPHLAECLRSSVALNGLEDRVTVGSSDLAPVALDGEDLPGRVAAIRIDVAGAELDVLRRARRLVDRDRPLLVVACGDAGELRRICDVAGGLGYSLVATHQVPPRLVFRPSPDGEVERTLVASLVTATEQLFDLRSARSALHEELSEQVDLQVRRDSEHAEREELARQEVARLEDALSAARADLDQVRRDLDATRRSLEKAAAEGRAVAARLTRTKEELASTRRGLQRVRAQRDALRRRRVVRWANRVGSMRRRFGRR
jgi:precorrin-6B methylase 2